MKYAFIKSNEQCFNVSLMCEYLGVSRSSYYDWCKHPISRREATNQKLDEAITSVFQLHKGKYGSPRITQDLKCEDIDCSENRVARRMKIMELKAKGRRKYKATTDSGHQMPVFANVLDRDFTATAPNQKYVSDITYIWTQEGWLYLCVFIDLYSRSIIGWSMNKSMNKDLVCNALIMALWRRGFPRGVIVHSDRGSQYASKKYRQLLQTNGLIGSMSRKGNCWDNACAESFFRTLKVEHIYDYNYETRDKAKQSIFEYIEAYYNKIRRHSTIGYYTPEQFEKLAYNECVG